MSDELWGAARGDEEWMTSLWRAKRWREARSDAFWNALCDLRASVVPTHPLCGFAPLRFKFLFLPIPLWPLCLRGLFLLAHESKRRYAHSA